MAKQTYRIRDPIHGLIEFSEREKRLIDTPAFQRLRRIRQLAMAFLVYPGALHTRFDHSIGVMHIVGRICTKLKELESNGINDQDVELMRFAALLHDVGHGPFSHVSEDILDEVAVAKAVADGADAEQARKKIHEKITVDIIQTDPDIKCILNIDERDFVVKLIEDKEMRDWRRNVISSELDADKMDYLLRDSYFAGVKYGQYDLEQIIESCRINKDRNATSLVISSEGIYALEQLLLARYHMTQQVYWHRVSLISSQMIIRGITLAIDGGNAEMTRLYQYPEKNEESDQDYEKKRKDFAQNYLNYHDEKVIDIVKNCISRDRKQKKAREIFDRLYNRNLFKMVAELPLKEVDDSRASSRLLKMENTEKQEWEQEIAKHLGIDAADVIVHKCQIRDPNYGSRSKILDPESIEIFDERHNVPRRIEYYATELSFVRSTSDDASLETVQVYASPDGWNLSKKQTPSELEVDIQNILCSV